MQKSDTIVVDRLKKSFKNLKVLSDLSFSVKKGTIVALLGPNGAGKTTTVRILSTLLLPSGGSASVSGFDVVKQPDEVRHMIGLTGQFAAVDEYLTGMENLRMMGKLYRLEAREIEKRSHELLVKFDLEEAAGRIVKTYSGGMKRRLDLAASLIAHPPILFLDEPTTGLDPRSRITMWDEIERLVSSGTTILLTTQYMDEADRLADRIVVIEDGKVIAEGTADTLKRQVGSERLEISVLKAGDFQKSLDLIGTKNVRLDSKRKTISLATSGGVGEMMQILNKLQKEKILVDGISLHRPTLDDVFLSLTGHAASDDDVSEQEGKGVEK